MYISMLLVFKICGRLTENWSDFHLAVILKIPKFLLNIKPLQENSSLIPCLPTDFLPAWPSIIRVSTTSHFVHCNCIAVLDWLSFSLVNKALSLKFFAAFEKFYNK